MEGFRWHFDNFTSEMQNTAYRYFVENNRDYKETQYYLNRHEKRFENILSKLAKEERKFVNEYIDKQTFKASCISNDLYTEGYKDCVKLLRELKII